MKTAVNEQEYFVERVSVQTALRASPLGGVGPASALTSAV